jgi:nucleoside-diphosphate-sugar epimerase
MNVKILVTGSSGFIGTKLVEDLIKSGHDVLGCDLVPARIVDEHFTHFTIDFTNMNELCRLFDSSKQIDVCYHLGAVANLNYARVHPLETLQVNINGTQNIAHLCSMFNTTLNFVSTCCVYGNTTVHPSPEDSPYDPTEMYGCSKISAEYVVKGFNRLNGLKYNILRPSTVYGPSMRSALAVYIFINNLLKGDIIPIHGSGMQTRCFLYVDDLIDGFIRVLDKGVIGETFNFAGKDSVRVIDLARICGELVQGIFLQITLNTSKIEPDK